MHNAIYMGYFYTGNRGMCPLCNFLSTVELVEQKYLADVVGLILIFLNNQLG